MQVYCFSICFKRYLWLTNWTVHWNWLWCFFLFLLLPSHFITFFVDCDSRKMLLTKNTSFTDCLCKTWISVLVPGKKEGAVNKLWNLNTDIVYLNMDSSVGVVIRLQAGWFEVWIPTKAGYFLFFKNLQNASRLHQRVLRYFPGRRAAGTCTWSLLSL